MSNDLTFFTNEPNSTLYDRFNKLLEKTKYFDILVGYFRSSGFLKLYSSFENVEKIRIIVGLNLDQRAIDIIEFSNFPTSAVICCKSLIINNLAFLLGTTLFSK